MYKHISIPQQILFELAYKGFILKQWFSHKSTVTPAELFSEVFLRTRVSQGKPKIVSVKSDGAYWKVKFRGLQPLFYPKDLPMYDLYIVAGENYTPTNWHYYNITETKVSKNDIVLDCGAAAGTFTLSVLKAKKIYAIEPLPKFTKALFKTFKKNKNVKILPIAVGKKEGKAVMFDGSFGSVIDNRKDGIEVKITTIDNLFFKKNIPVTYIKADLEGWELEMLKGAVKTIKKYKPKIAITTYHKKGDHLKIEEILRKINPSYKFKPKGLDRHTGNPIMLHAW